jgi:hypothetical protein
MKTGEKAQAKKRGAALILAKKLNDATAATNAFLRACIDAGDPVRGSDDGRVLLMAQMSEYASYLDAVYNKGPNP